MNVAPLMKCLTALLTFFVAGVGRADAAPPLLFTLPAGEFRLDSLPEQGLEDGSFHVRVRAMFNDAAKASVLLNYRTADDYYAVDFTVPPVSDAAEMYPAKVSYVFRHHVNGADSIILKSSFTGYYRLENPGVSVVVRTGNTGTSVSLGTRMAAVELAVPFKNSLYGMFGVSAQTRTDVVRYDMNMTARRRLPAVPFSDIEALRGHIMSGNNAVESFWSYLDRNIDPARASIGSFYNLATVMNDDGRILILDIDNGLRLKGVLTPSIFIDHYDLLWIDAAGRIIDIETNASIENGSILTLNFPHHKSSVRFRKVR